MQPAFDRETPEDPLDVALWTVENPPTRVEREAAYRVNAAEASYFGPPAPVASVAVERDAKGTYVRLAGRRIEAQQDGELVRIGRPEWLGRCPVAAAFACAALLRDGLADVAYITGRVFGSRQCWATFEQDGQEMALDITLADEAWALAEYETALHATVARRTPIRTYADLDALRERIEAELVW